MRSFLLILLGAVIAVIILKIVSSGKSGSSDIGNRFAALAKTGEAMNLIKTNEFKELIKTNEFRSLVKALAEEEVKTLANALNFNAPKKILSNTEIL